MRCCQLIQSEVRVWQKSSCKIWPLSQQFSIWAQPGLSINSLKGTAACVRPATIAISSLPIYLACCKIHHSGQVFNLFFLCVCVCSLLAWGPWHWQRGPSVNMTWSEWCTAASTHRERPSQLRTGTSSTPPAVNREGIIWDAATSQKRLNCSSLETLCQVYQTEWLTSGRNLLLHFGYREVAVL